MQIYYAVQDIGSNFYNRGTKNESQYNSFRTSKIMYTMLLEIDPNIGTVKINGLPGRGEFDPKKGHKCIT